ncbi:MAG TPA: hypothetical protein V6D47_09855 [Oscillatoriaceae cyanobacterium]
MNPELLEKMTETHDRGDDDGLAILMREYLQACDISSLPVDLQEIYCSWYDVDPDDDPQATRRIVSRFKEAFAKKLFNELTISSAMSYALQNPGFSRVGDIHPGVVELAASCIEALGPSIIPPSKLIETFKKHQLLLPIEHADALSDTLRRVYSKLASAARSSDGPSFNAARPQPPEGSK